VITMAIDPGISTGVAIHTDEYVTLVVTEPTKLWDLILANQPSIIAIENFASGGLISKDGQATIRLVGAMEFACYVRNIRLVIQFPKERYQFMERSREMLKQIKKTPISHEVDALAHLLLLEHRIDTNILDKLTSGRRNTWS
jgi:predicted sugar kinase